MKKLKNMFNTEQTLLLAACITLSTFTLVVLLSGIVFTEMNNGKETVAILVEVASITGNLATLIAVVIAIFQINRWNRETTKTRSIETVENLITDIDSTNDIIEYMSFEITDLASSKPREIQAEIEKQISKLKLLKKAFISVTLKPAIDIEIRESSEKIVSELETISERLGDIKKFHMYRIQYERTVKEGVEKDIRIRKVANYIKDLSLTRYQKYFYLLKDENFDEFMLDKSLEDDYFQHLITCVANEIRRKTEIMISEKNNLLKKYEKL